MSTAMDIRPAYEVREKPAQEAPFERLRAPSIPSRDPSPPLPRNPDFPKSASYTYIPHAKDSAYGSATSLPITIKGSFSEEDLIAHPDSVSVSPPDSSGWNTPNEDLAKVPADLARDLVAELQRSRKISVSRGCLQQEDDGPAAAAMETDGAAEADVGSARPRPARPNALRRQSTLVKRFSLAVSHSSSRASSPSSNTRSRSEHEDGGDSAPAPSVSQNRTKSVLRKRNSVRQPGDSSPEEKFPSRMGSMLRRRSSKRNSSTQMASGGPKGPVSGPAISVFQKSFSTDKLPMVREAGLDDRPFAMPRITSGERIPTLGSLAIPRKRDELWSVFRALEADYTKFTSKSTSLKANVVRTALLPFLRTYAGHASNRSLRPEDLDRRINILNRWWTGLLEMLHGKNNQSLSGTDRPAILDAVSGLMDRPEWRPQSSPYCPLAHRKVTPITTRKTSSSSVTSSGGVFLAESVQHNVRNLFVQNLTAQMAFVADKMSLRNASASLVTFCGRATAYAFFFCPGIADVLVRLWDVPADSMRRVLDEAGIDKFERLDEASARIASAFPPPMHSLSFTTLPKLTRTLRTQPSLPTATSNIQWYGFWHERWLGHESDLFYAFVKHFHILATDYLPPKATKKERMCIPGLLLVHSQILSNLDSTIHRNADPVDSASGPSDTLSLFTDPDAVASTLPLLPPNAIRIMAENRLIMLIRDFLSDRASDSPPARQLFAESFTDLLHACARRISIYDHAACYTLCDFLEEALLILVRYEHLHPAGGTLINAPFWRDVCRKMISSQNTMTEIRLYAFLYTVWGLVASDPGRKADLCLDLLLAEDIFERTFNHWCPMVRAYYMRLLCWRVGRFDGEATEVDIRIYETLYERLRSVWSHYLYLRNDADQAKALAPSTAPCNPAPGRRLLIVRTDTQVAPGGSFLAFNGVLPPTPSAPLPTASPDFRLKTTMSSVSLSVERPSPTRSPTSARLVTPASPVTPVRSSSASQLDAVRDSGLRGFLRSMLGSSSKSRSSSPTASRPSSRPTSQPVSTPSSPPPELATSLTLKRAATDDPRIPRARTPTSRTTSTPAPTHRIFCFKFSLEFHSKYATRPPPNMRLQPPRLPMAAQLFLQTTTARRVSPLNQQPLATKPVGEAKACVQYAGRALAEWTIIVSECAGFFDRRKGEGVPGDRYVETPTLGVEVFRKSG